MEDSLYQIQQGLQGVVKNFPVPMLAWLARLIVFPLGQPYSPPTDKTVKAIAKLLLNDSDNRDRLVDGVFISDRDDATGKVNKAFHLVLAAGPAERAIKNALKKSVNFENYKGLVKRATESGVITEEQATMVRLAQQASASVIAVDEFPQEQKKAHSSPDQTVSEQTEKTENSTNAQAESEETQ